MGKKESTTSDEGGNARRYIYICVKPKERVHALREGGEHQRGKTPSCTRRRRRRKHPIAIQLCEPAPAYSPNQDANPVTCNRREEREKEKSMYGTDGIQENSWIGELPEQVSKGRL